MLFERAHWPLEPTPDLLSLPLENPPRCRTRTIPSTMDNVPVTTVPVAVLGCGWLCAVVSGAATAAACFMWLLYACCVIITLSLACEKAIHLLRTWDEHQEERD
jgi:hypothetical protein